jgi:hypothetical protein
MFLFERVAEPAWDKDLPPTFCIGPHNFCIEPHKRPAMFHQTTRFFTLAHMKFFKNCDPDHYSVH